MRIRFVIDGEGIAPQLVAVAAFFALELRIRNDTPRAQRVAFRGRRVGLRPGRSARLLAPGVRPGRYSLDAGAAGRATIVARP